MTDTSKIEASRDETIRFLETACRNWDNFPMLRSDDIADVQAALGSFLSRRMTPVQSAAPDLYEALNDCIAVLTDPVVGTVKHDDPDWYMALDRAVTKARAALSKASPSSSKGSEG